ncbi:MAG: hypothetical protein F2704_01050 [Actinobacteria bacterium]|uniref:Unannotated protein n=1 Tax=freshwater metagenome TaxID=449393 RepID=A0A6J7HSC4_9ZZZZ|nr:hypothetical protein [Actinomycetota bacterium]MSX24754.1 hypothetical protein [Actinomycetota bacterium]MSY45936.1 hypothetical protein [Actinomycetota bacterium]MSY56838.1 hypothetical protein [Actinomycetota bacterium]MTB00513.1 hypothetical protein [Actinomycetota bacterium]
MSNDKPEKKFEAPQWVLDENNPDLPEPSAEVSKKQRIVLVITLIFVFPFCMWAGWFEFGRAQSGNWRAWVYTFEWPFFGGIAIYLFRRLMRGDVPKIPRPDLDALARAQDEEASEK